MENIIGRQEEIEILQKLYESKQAEFLAIYGRRRIGKTYLVTEFFRDKGIFFEVTGSATATTKEQLLRFHREFCGLFKREEKLKPPKNWEKAFLRLKDTIAEIKNDQKIVLFFDELPWLASPKSRFLSALDYYWNRHFSRMPQVLLIVSGSSASWMINEILNHKGGLYGRLSAHLRLKPFSLSEVEQFLQSKGIILTRKQICEIYMVTGGVPKYLSFLKPASSSAQCIQSLCFTPQSPLIGEFHKLFHSLFKHPASHIELIRALAYKRQGMERTELVKEAKLPKGGHSSKVLRELEESDFITIINEVGKKSRSAKYALSDEYSLFYLHWIDPVKSSILRGDDNDYWMKQSGSSAWLSWAGLAFESLCLKHVHKIKDALKIGGVSSRAGYWKSLIQGKKHSEIDLVIDRADQCINLCEIKFCNAQYQVSKSYAQELQSKKENFRTTTRTKKTLFTTLITPYGASPNPAYLSAVDKQIVIDELF
ncbi:MAG TPA: ATP-binding protein [Rhabdochlamydiaceae bacterium]|nr:ATP-binding protein [Rhabdochlamydiaceae bacterium]